MFNLLLRVCTVMQKTNKTDFGLRHFIHGSLALKKIFLLCTPRCHRNLMSIATRDHKFYIARTSSMAATRN